MLIRRFPCAAVCLVVSALAAYAQPADADKLVRAVKAGDATVVRALLSRHADVNRAEPDGATALHWAAYLGTVDLADQLIRAGARVDAVNDYGVTPLLLACSNADPAMTNRLLAAGANPNAALLSGETALMTAARTGNAAVVKAVIAAGGQVNAAESLKGQTALMWAVSEHHLDVVRLLLESGANVTARTRSGFTAPLFAAREGTVDTVRVLLEHGADVNDAGAADGSTMLLVATVRGHVDLARFLLEQGADPNIATAGYTPLHWAAGTWESAITNDKYHFDAGEWQALAGIPSRAAKIELIKTLLAHGADPNARVTQDPPRYGATLFKRNYTIGGTPFYLAAMVGDLDVMRLLLANRAAPEIAAKDHTTPLMVAAGLTHQDDESRITEQEHLAGVRLILEMGSDPAAVNDAGFNALHAAAYAGFNTIVQYLVDHGAPLNERTKAGQTALGIAEGNTLSGFFFERVETAAFLRRLGAVSVGRVTLESSMESAKPAPKR